MVLAPSRSAHLHRLFAVLKPHWSGASEGGVLAGGGPGADTSSLDRWIPTPGAPLLGRGRSELFPTGDQPVLPAPFFFFGPFIGEDSAGPKRAPVT